MRPVRGVLKAGWIVLLAVVLLLAHLWALLALRFCAHGDGVAFTLMATYLVAAAAFTPRRSW